jgi:hypothetical protein
MRGEPTDCGASGGLRVSHREAAAVLFPGDRTTPRNGERQPIDESFPDEC